MTHRQYLTSRQSDILRLVVCGKSDAEIAADLGVATSTVKTHLGSIYRSLHVHNRMQAVMAAHREGYVTLWGEQLSIFDPASLVTLADLRAQVRELEDENARLRKALTERAG